MPDVYLETVELHGRLFQKHALQNKIYFGPVDEVSCSPAGSPERLQDAHAEDRKRHSASSFSTTYSKYCSTRGLYSQAPY